MAVTNLLTLMEDMESPGALNTIGGGAGPTTNTDIFIAGAQSVARRSSNVTTHGFWVNCGATFDLSGAGQHVKIWTWQTHYSVLTALQYRLGSDTSNYETHTYPIASIPALGGWFPAWLEVGTGVDTGTPNFTIIDEVAQTISLPTVGGNAQNNVMDQVHHGTSGMRWDGAGGDLADFRTTEAANALGVFLTINGIDYLFSRLEVGSATSTTFTQTGHVIVFPDQPLCSTTFMGLTFDLQHASTDISLTDGVISSSNPAGASRRGDVLVTGTSGLLDISRNTFAGVRLFDLNSRVTANDCVFTNTGQVTADGADLSGSTLSGYEGTANTSMVVWDVNTDPNGLLDNTTYTKGTAATHAIEFGLNSPTTLTFNGINFSGYNASNNQNDSAIHIKRTSGTVTINVSGGSGTVSYRTDGATVVVQQTVTLAITVQDEAKDPIENAQTSIYLANSPFTELMNEDTNASGLASESYNYPGSPVDVIIRVRKSALADSPRYLAFSDTAQINANGLTRTVTLRPNPVL